MDADLEKLNSSEEVTDEDLSELYAEQCVDNDDISEEDQVKMNQSLELIFKIIVFPLQIYVNLCMHTCVNCDYKLNLGMS